MEKYSSAELLTMSSIDPNDLECKSAFEHFYHRYKIFVWSVSVKCASNIDKNNLKDIAHLLHQNTFIDVNKNAGKFVKQSEDEDTDIKKWLSGIVKNKLLQFIDENNKQKKHLIYEDIQNEPLYFIEIDDNINIESFEKKLLSNALNTLSEKERDIILTWYNFYDGDKIQDIPKDIKQSLSKQYNMLPESLKQTKLRAFKKLKDYIDKNNKDK